MRVAVLSDTHAPTRWTRCPPAVARHLEGVDLILHAGDVCRAGVLEELAAFAPVRAVLGNNDTLDVAAWGAPETLLLDLDGLAVGMVHDAGQARGRVARMAGRFPGADLVVFGHSHIPLDSGRGHGSRSQSPRLAERKPGLRLAKPKPGGGPRIFNPGSPTDRRSQPVGTMGLLEIVEGRLRSARIVPVT